MPSMVKLAMPTEDAVKDPCEQNLRLLQNRIESEFSNLVEARSEQGELDRIKSREINLIEVSAMFSSHSWFGVYKNHKLKSPCICSSSILSIV